MRVERGADGVSDGALGEECLDDAVRRRRAADAGATLELGREPAQGYDAEAECGAMAARELGDDGATGGRIRGDDEDVAGSGAGGGVQRGMSPGGLAGIEGAGEEEPGHGRGGRGGDERSGEPALRRGGRQDGTWYGSAQGRNIAVLTTGK